MSNQMRKLDPQVAYQEIANALVRAWETGDLELLDDLFAPDAVYQDRSNGHDYRGIDEIKQYVAHVHAWASDTRMKIEAMHICQDGAVVESVFTGVQDRPIGEILPVATGRRFALVGVTVLEIEAGKIRRAADCYADLSLALQLGGRLEMPGGGHAELPLP